MRTREELAEEASTMVDKLDLYRNDEIVCPYCGHHYQDSVEFFHGYFYRKFEEECEKCGEEFKVEVECDWSHSFTTSKKDHNGE